jgi:hypothetical protein
MNSLEKIAAVFNHKLPNLVHLGEFKEAHLVMRSSSLMHRSPLGVRIALVQPIEAQRVTRAVYETAERQRQSERSRRSQPRSSRQQRVWQHECLDDLPIEVLHGDH